MVRCFFYCTCHGSVSLSSFWKLGGFTAIYIPFLKVIWHACVWVIWKERNNRIFNNKAEDLCKLLDNVKLMSFLWLRANKLTSAFSYHDWWRHPLLCFGVREQSVLLFLLPFLISKLWFVLLFRGFSFAHLMRVNPLRWLI